MNLDAVALNVPIVLLPKKGIDLSKWAVVACDQYTSEVSYWEKIKEDIGNLPSTLNIMLPEVYLEAPDAESRISDINAQMQRYLAEGILVEQQKGFILLDRKTAHVPSRKGLIVALDLEQYDFSKGATSLIRATEGTLMDRLPPRIKIRKEAPLELPHIMVLIDDPDKTVIEPLFQENLEKIYDFELMENSGHLSGYKVADSLLIQKIADNLAQLADRLAFNEKYGTNNEEPLVYAMGDGNHSLATAKVIWEELKETAEDKKAIMLHPARYALVELVNVHDDGLVFEPIHRVLFGTSIKHLTAAMKTYFNSQSIQISLDFVDKAKTIDIEGLVKDNKQQAIVFCDNKEYGILTIHNPQFNLPVASLQVFLDDYLAKNKSIMVDYIHGAEVVSKLSSKEGNIGFYLDVLSKEELFKTIILDGALPRKTFSMGEADEKRFYLECRKIKK